MIAKILITLAVTIFTVIIPILEVNASHVFNESWPPHARFHEVWQLITNCCLGILCLWLAWARDQVRFASVLVILVMGGALASHALEGFYGGSILSGNLSKTVLGLELAAFGASLSVLMAIAATILDARSRKAVQSRV